MTLEAVRRSCQPSAPAAISAARSWRLGSQHRPGGWAGTGAPPPAEPLQPPSIAADDDLGRHARRSGHVRGGFDVVPVQLDWACYWPRTGMARCQRTVKLNTNAPRHRQRGQRATSLGPLCLRSHKCRQLPRLAVQHWKIGPSSFKQPEAPLTVSVPRPRCARPPGCASRCLPAFAMRCWVCLYLATAYAAQRAPPACRAPPPPLGAGLLPRAPLARAAG